jgi:hypothetical protein
MKKEEHNRKTDALRNCPSPDSSGKPGEGLVHWLVLDLEHNRVKAIIDCFCEGCERSSTGYAEPEKG